MSKPMMKIFKEKNKNQLTKKLITKNNLLTYLMIHRIKMNLLLNKNQSLLLNDQ
jgi:hypothetical protein